MSNDGQDGKSGAAHKDLSDAAKRLTRELMAHESQVNEEREIESARVNALGGLWWCTKHGLPHEFNPRNDREKWETRTARFIWPDYAEVWVLDAMQPAAQALIIVEGLFGVSAEELITYSPTGNHKPKLEREEYTRIVFGGVLVAVRRGIAVPSELIHELGMFLSQDPDGWEHFHSYFEAAYYALKRYSPEARPTGLQRVASEEQQGRTLIASRLRGKRRETALSTYSLLVQATDDWLQRTQLKGQFGLSPPTVDADFNQTRPEGAKRITGGRVQYSRAYVTSFVSQRWRPKAR